MEEEVTFEELYEAYQLCLKNKKRKVGTYNFVNDCLCENLIKLVDNLLAKTNSQIGTLKRYNCRELIFNYAEVVKEKTEEIIWFDEKEIKFKAK